MNLKELSALGGVEIYMVGGCVRDTFLNIEAKDVDFVVTGISPEKMEQLGFEKPVGVSFPVYLVEVDGHGRCEVALARTEKKTGVGYHGFEVETENVSIEEDLGRRDLTVNAMAVNYRSGEMIDPYGGLKDIEDKVLRPVSSAFKEDPLRVYRVARFAARFPEFTIADEIFGYVNDVKEELQSLAAERVSEELFKALKSKKPSRFFDVLDDFGVLDEHLSEIKALQVPDKHDGTAYRHVLNLLDRCGRAKKDFDMKILFGLFAHDFGKGTTPAETLPAHHDHDKRGEPMVDDFCKRMRISNELRKFGKRCARSHITMRRLMEMKPAKVLKFVDLYKDDFESLALVAFLDAVYRDGADPIVEGKLYKGYCSVGSKAFKTFSTVTGKQLIEKGVEPGPAFGPRLLEARISHYKTL